MAWLWEFDQAISIEAMNDTDAKASFDLLDGDVAQLTAVVILGRKFDAAFIATWLGRGFVDQITRDAQEWYVDEGRQQYEEYCAGQAADMAYDDRLVA